MAKRSKRKSKTSKARADFTKDETDRMASLLHQIGEYEAQQSTVEGQLTTIKTRITELHSSYATIYNRRSSILSLPDEVTCRIFENAVDGGRGSERLMEVVVSHVCQRWRSISLGYPHLWTNFFYKYWDSLGNWDPIGKCWDPLGDSKETKVPHHRFETYMQRSGTLPLCLWFDFKDDNTNNPDHPKILNKAIDHVKRWKHFTLLADESSGIFQSLLRLEEADAPLLEGFVIDPGYGPLQDARFEHYISDEVDGTIFRNFGAPNLKYAFLATDAIPSFIPPLWTITRLRLQSSENPRVQLDLMEILTLPSLEHLSLFGDFDEMTDDSHKIEMDKLTRFQVGSFNGIWSYLVHIRAPRLESLLLHELYITSDAIATSAHSLNHYTFPALRNLWLADVRMQKEPAHHLLRMTVGATDVLISSPARVSFWRILLRHPNTKNIWPRLNVMTSVVRHFTAVGPYLDFAKSRSTPFTLRVPNAFVSFWKTNPLMKGELLELRKLCTVERLTEGDYGSWWPEVEPYWPDEMETADYFVPDCARENPFYIEYYGDLEKGDSEDGHSGKYEGDEDEDDSDYEGGEYDEDDEEDSEEEYEEEDEEYSEEYEGEEYEDGEDGETK